MEEAEYPSMPTQPRENQTSQSYMGRFLSTKQSDSKPAQSVTRSSKSVGEHLQYNGAMSATRNQAAKKTFRHNKNLRRKNKKLNSRNKSLHNTNNSLKSRIEQLTAVYDGMNTEKTRIDKEYTNVIFKIFSSYASGQGLNPDDLTIERAQGIWNAISSEAEAFKHLRAQLEGLRAQTEAMRKDPMASRSQCQSLEERQFDQDAKLQNSPQNLEFFQEETRGLRTQVQVL